MKLDFERGIMSIDAERWDELTRQTTFNALSDQSQLAFEEYLRRQGINPDTVNETKVEQILAVIESKL